MIYSGVRKSADISLADRRRHGRSRQADREVFTACPWSWCRLTYVL